MAGFIFGRGLFIAATSWLVVVAGGGPAFLKRPVGMAYLTLWVIWWIATFAGRRAGRHTKYDRGQRPIVVVLGSTLIPILILAPSWEYSHLTGPIPRDGTVAWLGLCMFAAGIILQWESMRALGASFTVRLGVEPGRALVTSGPYRHIRHPAYLSYLVSMTGMSLGMGSIATCVVVLVAGLFIVRRVKVEEEMLLTEYGETYSKYMEDSWRLLPWFY